MISFNRLTLESQVSVIASGYEIDPVLVAAFIDVESDWDPLAVRFEPNWKTTLEVDKYAKLCKTTSETERILQCCSWGLMQVMGTVARELGLNDNLLLLSSSELGVRYGCIKLKRLFSKYNRVDDVIAAYNAGTPVVVDGKYRNQVYVDKVKRAHIGRVKNTH